MQGHSFIKDYRIWHASEIERNWLLTKNRTRFSLPEHHLTEKLIF